MKKIIFVNNNMKIGGIQKALVNLLKELSPKYKITLFLFNKKGEYLKDIPSNVEILECKSFFQYIGKGQQETKQNIFDYFVRGFFAFLTKLFGRSFALKFIGLNQRKLKGEYDYAISYMQNGAQKSFYGGCNEFVLKKISAKEKISFVHCDYSSSGANNKKNDKLYFKFDKIAFCSDGCRESFEKVLPDLKKKCYTVRNCHDFQNIFNLANETNIIYKEKQINIVSVARLTKEKGIDRGLYSIKYLKDKGFSVHYHIVGDGIIRDELQELVRTLNISDNVSFYGNKANPYPYVLASDILLIPSYHEAAPIVIDEAVCLNVPVLSTETTSVKEMISDRKIGFVCKNDQDSLNKKLEILLQDWNQVKKVKDYIAREVVLDNKNSIDSFVQMLGEK